MESHLAPPQANTAATYQPPIPHSRLLPLRPTIPTPLSPPPPPLLICLPLSGQRHPPQTEHSGGPLGDPSARVFEVFLTVSQSVSFPLSFWPKGLLGPFEDLEEQEPNAQGSTKIFPDSGSRFEPLELFLDKNRDLVAI